MKSVNTLCLLLGAKQEADWKAWDSGQFPATDSRHSPDHTERPLQHHELQHGFPLGQRLLWWRKVCICRRESWLLPSPASGRGWGGTAITGVHRSGRSGQTGALNGWCAGTVQAHTLAYTRYHSDPLALAQISTHFIVRRVGRTHSQGKEAAWTPPSGILL